MDIHRRSCHRKHLETAQTWGLVENLLILTVVNMLQETQDIELKEIRKMIGRMDWVSPQGSTNRKETETASRG